MSLRVRHPFAYLGSLGNMAGHVDFVISVRLVNSTMDCCIEATNNTKQVWKPVSLHFTSVKLERRAASMCSTAIAN